jgi:hypothetical protein
LEKWVRAYAQTRWFDHEGPRRLYMKWNGMEMVCVIMCGKAKRRCGSINVEVHGRR